MIEALAFSTADAAKEAVAVSRSALTSNTWNGELLLFTDVGAAPSRGKSVARVETRTASAAVGWVGPRTVISGDDEGVVSVWEWRGDGTLERVARLIEHDDMVSSLDCNGAESVLSSSHDGSVKIWDVSALTPDATPKSGGTFGAHATAVHTARFQREGDRTVPNTRMAASGDMSGRVCLWDARKMYSAAAAIPLNAHGAAAAVEWLTSKTVAVGSADGTLHMYDIRRLDAPLVAAEQIGAGGIRSLASRGGTDVLVGTDGGVVLQCGLSESGKFEVGNAGAVHTDSVRVVGWRPSEPATVVSGGWDGKVIVQGGSAA